MVTSLNIFRFSLGDNSHNLNLDIVSCILKYCQKKSNIKLLTVCTLSLLKCPTHILSLHEVYM